MTFSSQTAEVEIDGKMRQISFGFFTFNGWVSAKEQFGIIDESLYYGNVVNPIFLTLVDKIDGDLPPMVVDYAIYKMNKIRRSEIAKKIAANALVVINNGLAPCVPVYAADAGSDNPALSPSLNSNNINVPAISVSEAFESVQLGKPSFIECPHHIIERVLAQIKEMKFSTLKLVDVTRHLDEFTHNDFDRAA